MSRKAFKELLQKYIDGKCNAQESALVEQWYDLLDREPEELTSIEELDDYKFQLWQKIEQKTIKINLPLQTKEIPLWKKVSFRISAAACLLLALTFSLLKINQKNTETLITEKNTEGFYTTTNTSSAKQIITLEDGTKVTLQPAGSLRVPNHFSSDKREVYLAGNAFFNVTKNPEKPFFVYAGKITTKVLGTSFFIKSEPKTANIEVEVVTGRVSVFEKTITGKKEENGVILTPNHKVTYFPESNLFVTGLVSEPVQLNNVSNAISFKYDDVPLSAVLDDLEKNYGIDIMLENEHISTCTITANLAEKPLYTKLDIICGVMRASYTVNGTTILITGKGCE